MAGQIPEEKLAVYKSLIATHPGMEVKGAKKLSYTSMNGNMYTMVTKEGKIGLRLAKEDYDAFLVKFDAQPLKSYGATMREYVEVPGEMLKNLEILKPYLVKSHEYAKTLKPKPTKTKK